MSDFDFVEEPAPDCPECGRSVNGYRHLINHIQWMMRNADSIEEREAHAWSQLPLDRRDIFDKASLPYTITPVVPKSEDIDFDTLFEDHESVIEEDNEVSHEPYDATDNT